MKNLFVSVILLAASVQIFAQNKTGIRVSVMDQKRDDVTRKKETEKAQFILHPTETVVFDAHGVATMTQGDGTEAISALPMKYNGELHVAFDDYDESTNIIEPVVNNDGGYGTFYSAFRLKAPADQDVYVANYSDGHVWIDDEKNVSGKILPVRTALLLKGNATYTFDVEQDYPDGKIIDTDKAPIEVDENSLDGNSVDIDVNIIKKSGKILLTYGPDDHKGEGYVQTDEWGFWEYFGSLATACKSYLLVDREDKASISGAKGVSIVFGDATSIDEVIPKQEIKDNGLIYNVAGQRVGEGYHGVIIKNGKKYLQK